MKKVLLISGSLRAESYNTSLLRAFETKLTDDAQVAWADINLPLFNEELEADFPAAAETLRQQILNSDVIIIATPEYNRGTTGALKNAIDWASRPYGQNAWQGKRVLVVSASYSSLGGAMAAYQVKQSLLHLDAVVLGQPEFMVGDVSNKFDETNRLVDEKTKEHISLAIQKLLTEQS